MRRVFILLIFIFVVCMVQTVEARKLALLVGVDDYADVVSLKCCVNDMKTLKAALLNVGFTENDMFILTTGSPVRDMPTKENIEQKVSEILAAARSGDLVFIAFAGHGVREGETDYFCPPFVKMNNIKGTCVSITKVMDDLSKCEASFKWMVVDACRNELNSSRGVTAFQVIPTPPQGIALFQSCNKGEESYEESQEGGNSYFMKNLAAALSGQADYNNDGKLTLLEVCTWTTSQTQADVEKVKNKTQRPYLNISAVDFTLSEDLNVPKAIKLVEKARKAVEEGKYELAVQIFDEAIALCPRLNSIRRERNAVQRLHNADNRIRETNQKSREEAEKHDLSIPGKMEGERKTLTVDGIEIAFRWCPPGTFTMGSPEDEPGKKEMSEEYNIDFNKIEKQHKVTLTKGFWMMETEVTVGMFKMFVSDTGYGSVGNPPFRDTDQKLGYTWRNPGFSQDNNHPVTCVSWHDSVAFCKWLSKKTGQNITLPTETQWEYACRAGSITALPNGPIVIEGMFDAPALDPIAWYGGNSRQRIIVHSDMDSSKSTGTHYFGEKHGTHPVGKKIPNNWGLYDMIGNVWEWCSDWYSNYPSESVTDPTGPSTGHERIFRGGSWGDTARACRSAYRYGSVPEHRSYAVGFRCITGQ